MSGIDLTAAQAQLNAYLAAETAVLKNQKYELAGRMVTRANLAEIQAGIKTWDERVKQLTATARGRTRARTIVVRG